MVQDLINQIVDKTGIPADKAQQVLGIVGQFVKQTFPVAGGQVDSLLGTGGQTGDGEANHLLGGIGSKLGL